MSDVVTVVFPSGSRVTCDREQAERLYGYKEPAPKPVKK